ncbi:MAG: aspartate/glutamate racemase family protein [Alphaproteobacteria bacterium]|nr:aspartate/glutamate racemase family protein [Alphaproteobacteria bacterium]NNF24318.1 aspartate/glutamate racemase family protein [Paracoccaceae bacterium]
MTGFIGVLSLDTRFERISGDAGNPESYPIPARVAVVADAGPPQIVSPGRPAPDLVRAFCDAAQELEKDGAVALVSTCGFLGAVQDEIARAVSVPVMVSAVALLPVVKALHGGRPVGILTASRASLEGAPWFKRLAGAEDAAVAGMEDCPAFAESFLAPKQKQCAALDRKAVEAAVLAKSLALVQHMPQIGCLLLECGNLPPFAPAIAATTGRRVYSILDGARLIAPG